MSDYYIQSGELYHYGVPGMKWGHRKAQNKSTGSVKASLKTRRLAKAVERQKKVAKSWDDASPIKLKSGETFMTSKEVKETRDAAYDRLKKLNTKLLISQKADRIYAGKSAAGKILSSITNEHRYQAEIEYDIEKRAKVNKAWRD